MWKNMSKRLLPLAVLGLITAVLASSPAAAQATRTWVSGEGDDANPCSRTEPCKTWAGAISKTLAGGEIDALDPGGFGALTITKAITLDGGGGQVASVLVQGTNGITVAAGASDVVILRNLRINGLNSGINGIAFNSGAQLNVENCEIFGFTQNGINANTTTTPQSELYVTDTTITNSGNGISLAATTGLYGVIDHTNIFNVTTNGIAGGTGSVNFTITNTAIASAATAVKAGATGTRFNFDTSTIHLNNVAFNAAASGAQIRISNNLIYDNSTNFTIATGGKILSSGNNRISQDSTAPNGAVQQQ
jgi:hypothetical protein